MRANRSHSKAPLSVAVTAAALSIGLVSVDVHAQMLEEVVVTARKRAESLLEVPVTVTAFSEAEIGRAGIERPSDFLLLTPNVTFASSESAGVNFMTIRGVSQVRNGESPVAVVVDGVLMTDPGQFDQELFDIQQIEVMKGPQGALYGRNAIGGAINITTVAPSDSLEGKVVIGGGNGNRRRGAFALSTPLSDSVAVRVSGSHVEHDGYIKNTFLNKDVDFYEDTALRGRLVWDASESFNADLRLARVRTEGGALNFVVNADWYAGDFVGDANDTSRPYTANRLGTNERDIDSASMKLDWDLNWATLTSITSWTDQSEFYAASAYPYECVPDCVSSIENSPFSQAFVDLFGSPPFGEPGSFVPVQVVKVNTSVETVSQEFRITSPDDQDFRWITGAYWLSTDRQRGLPTEVDVGQPYDKRLINDNTLFAFADDNDNTAYAVFGQFEYDVTEKLELAFAVRYDKDEREQVDTSPISATFGKKRKREFSETQPKFTATYALSDDSSLFAVASKGFRSGGFNQNGVGQAAELAGIAGISDEYTKEVSTNAEIGYKSSFMEGKLRVDAAVFYTELEDQHYFQFLGAINAQLLNNIDEVELYGFELGSKYFITEDLSINAAYGRTDSEITDYTVDPSAVGNWAPYVARNTINAGFQYTPILAGDLQGLLRLDWNRSGKQYWDTSNSTPRSAVDLVNLRVGISSLSNGWDVTLWAKNLTDEEYNAEFVSGGIAQLATPRTYGIDLSYEF